VDGCLQEAGKSGTSLTALSPPSPNNGLRETTTLVQTLITVLDTAAASMDDPFARTTDDSPEAQIEAIKTYAAQLPVDPSLRTLGEGHDATAIDTPIPEVRATPTEEKFKDFATDTVTHVVIS